MGIAAAGIGAVTGMADGMAATTIRCRAWDTGIGTICRPC